MPIEGIKMSLTHSCPPPPPPAPSAPHVSYSQSLSLLNLGRWPSATKDTKANKSSSFQHLPSPKGLPTTATPSLVKMGPWLYSSFSIPPYSPTDTPSLNDKTSIVPCPSEEETLFSPLDKSRLKPRWGLPAEMPGTRQGCPLSPFHFSPAFWFIHPLVSLSFLLLILPSCGGHSLSSPPPFS